MTLREIADELERLDQHLRYRKVNAWGYAPRVMGGYRASDFAPEAMEVLRELRLRIDRELLLAGSSVTTGTG